MRPAVERTGGVLAVGAAPADVADTTTARAGSMSTTVVLAPRQQTTRRRIKQCRVISAGSSDQEVFRMAATSFSSEATAAIECTARTLAIFGAGSTLPTVLEAADILTSRSRKPCQAHANSIDALSSVETG